MRSSSRSGWKGGWVAAVAALVILPAAIPCAAQTAQKVRNEAPQSAAVPPDEQWPLYYPRSARPSDVAAIGDEASPEELLHRYVNLHTAMRYAEALQVAWELARIAPDRPIAHYNIACSLARLQRIDGALAALERAVACGWRNVAHTSIDTDLAVLRGRDGFEALLEQMMRLAEAERIEPGPLCAGPWQEIAGELSERVPDLLQRYHVPGAAIALVRDGQCVWTSAFGAADRRSGEPLSDDAVFAVASPGHLLALIAAVELDESDRLDLAELLLESEKIARRPEEERGTGGVRHWRVNRSGRMSEAFGPVRRHRSTNGSGGGGAADLARWPGAAASQAETVDLLRLAVEVAGATTFGRYCDERVLRPLRMTTTMVGAPRQAGANVSTGHTRLGSALRPLEAKQRGSLVTATTVRDLARLVELMLSAQDDAGEDGPARVLSAGSAERITELGELDLRRLGLGVRTDRTETGPRVQVAGVTGGCGCLMRWYPDSGCGVVILFNSETGPEAALRIAHLALGGG